MSRPAFKTLQVTWGKASGEFALVAFNRPKQKNAITGKMYEDIGAVLDYASATDDVGGLIFTGNGDYYCSGNDLSNFSQLMHPRTMAAEAKVKCEKYVNSYVNCTKPLIAAVNGPSIGIATTTLGLCDVRICADNATFYTPFKKLGQAPEGCSSFMFPRLLGDKMAHDLLDGGRTINAQEALEAKFVSQVLTPTTVVDRALEIAHESSSGKKPIQRFTLQEPGLVAKLQDVNRRECEVLEKAWVSPECFEALDEYLRSRGKTTPANVLKFANMTRFLWDR